MKKHIVIDKIKPDNYLVRGVGKRAIHIGGELIIETARDFELDERDFLIALAKQACARGWKKAEVVRTTYDAGGYFLNLAAAKGRASGYRVLPPEMLISKFIKPGDSAGAMAFWLEKLPPQNFSSFKRGEMSIQPNGSAGGMVDESLARSFAVAREVQMLKDSMAASKKCREDFKNSLSDEVTDAARKTSDGLSSGISFQKAEALFEFKPKSEFHIKSFRVNADGSGSGVVHASKHPLEHLLAPSDGNGTEITSKEGQRKLPHRALGECEVYEHGGWRGLGQHPFDQFLFTPEELSAKMSAYPNVDFLVHPEIHNDSAVGELRVEPFIETPFVLEDEDSVQIVSVKNRDASIPQPDQPGEPE